MEVIMSLLYFLIVGGIFFGILYFVIKTAVKAALQESNQNYPKHL
jgi:hypothetical protein